MWKFGKKSTEKQMQEYMRFYYPTSGQVRYEILFDWGMYTITTEAKPEKEVSEESRPYSGYITMRPTVAESSSEDNLPVYLITPEGQVWKNGAKESIPEMSTRQEITQEKSESSTTTHTLTIQSISEPVIDHFRDNAGQWTLYGTLETKGSKSSLKLIES